MTYDPRYGAGAPLLLESLGSLVFLPLQKQLLTSKFQFDRGMRAKGLFTATIAISAILIN